MTKVSRCALALCLSLMVSRANAAAPYQHVLLLSLDGLHDADLTDPATNIYLPSVLDLANHASSIPQNVRLVRLMPTSAENLACNVYPAGGITSPLIRISPSFQRRPV